MSRPHLARWARAVNARMSFRQASTPESETCGEEPAANSGVVSEDIGKAS